MKKLFFPLILIVLAFVSCASPQFFYDYDRQADFSQFRSYNFYSDMKTSLSDLDTERVFTAIDSAMQAKGISKTTNPDMKINLYASYFKTPSRNRLGIGVGGGGGHVGVGISGGIPIGGPDLYLKLTIELVEFPSNVLFWQTVIESRFHPDMSPKQRSAYFHELIAEALEKYPPE